MLTKAYDGTDSVTKNLVLGTTYTFGDQVISGDTVSIDAAKAVGAYAGKNVGDDKTISYNGITLTGADAGNYTIDGSLKWQCRPDYQERYHGQPERFLCLYQDL